MGFAWWVWDLMGDIVIIMVFEMDMWTPGVVPR